MKVLALLISLSLSLPVYADAVFYNGNDLLSQCREHSKFLSDREHNAYKAAACLAYMVSASDAHGAYVAWERMPPYFCKPDGVTQGQLTDIVIKYLEANPEKLHLSAGGLVANALYAVFPCE